MSAPFKKGQYVACLVLAQRNFVIPKATADALVKEYLANPGAQDFRSWVARTAKAMKKLAPGGADTALSEYRQDPRHNHITHDIKEFGECPACDRFTCVLSPAHSGPCSSDGAPKEKPSSTPSTAPVSAPPSPSLSTGPSDPTAGTTRAPTSLDDLAAAARVAEWQALREAANRIHEAVCSPPSPWSPAGFTLWAIQELCRAVPR